MSNEVEPQIAKLLDRKATGRGLPPYRVATAVEVADRLDAFFAEHLPAARITNVKRLSGGASKEQFEFDLGNGTDFDGRYVLRMDPLEALVETSRRREYEALNAFRDIVPVPPTLWLDDDGSWFGQPSMIMAFCNGTTAPTDKGGNTNVSGTGIKFSGKLRQEISEEFVKHLVAIHNADWRSLALPSFSDPGQDRRQVARWRIGWCERVWQADKVCSSPTMALALLWLNSNMPECDEPVFVHGDYRTGNYLFDEATGKFTAILDWELCHIGDFHEDLAWTVHRVCGTWVGDEFRCCGLMPRGELIGYYERVSGRTVDRNILHFYEILMAVQTICMVAASGLSAARAAHSHQDVLLNWSGGVQHILLSELCRMLREGPDTLHSNSLEPAVHGETAR